jgi:hypothetical protein
MEKITINNKVYDLPTTWGELTLRKYINLAGVITKYEGSDVDDDMYANVIMPQIVKTVLDVTEKDVKKITVVQYAQIREALNFINKPLPKFTPKSQTVSNGYKIKIIDLQAMKFGVWADVQHLLSAEPIKNIPTVFAMLVNVEKHLKWYQKLFKKNKQLDDNELLEVINEQPVSEIFAINNFFLLTILLLKQNILSSSAPAEMKVQLMKQLSLLDGLTTSG